MGINSALLNRVRFDRISGDLGSRLDRYIAGPLRYLAFRALLYRTLVAVFLLLVSVFAATPTPWAAVLRAAFSSAITVVVGGIAVLLVAAGMAFLSAVLVPVLPRSADPRYYLDTGINTRLLDNWVSVLFQDVPLRATDRNEALRTAIGELAQQGAGEASDTNGNTVKLLDAAIGTNAQDQLQAAGLRISFGMLIADALAVLLLLSMCTLFSAFLIPVP